MSKKLKWMIFGVLLVYFLVHWYIMARLIQLLGPLSPVLTPLLHALILLLGLAYPAGRLANLRLPGVMGDRLIIAGCFWMGAALYAFLGLIVLDSIALLDRYVRFLPEYLAPNQPHAGLLVIILALSAVIFGTLNAQKFAIRRLNLEINKPSPTNPLTIVSISDLHLGLLVGSDRLKQLVAIIQELDPDLIVLPGDILDETVGVFVDCRMADDFRSLTPRFGIYGCLGSHEYIWGSADKAIYYLSNAGITILRDEHAVINDSFVLAGRDDIACRKFTRPRKDLSEILHGVDQRLPLILLDHTPTDMAAGAQCGIDLQLFGHTHGGQIFPFNLFVALAYPLSRGYAKFGNCHTFVSSGFGVWGIPLRIGSRAEIVHITLNFKN